MRIDKGDKHAYYSGNFYTYYLAVSSRVYCVRVFGFEFVGFMLFIRGFLNLFFGRCLYFLYLEFLLLILNSYV